jgi:hypothetical protein
MLQFGACAHAFPRSTDFAAQRAGIGCPPAVRDETTTPGFPAASTGSARLRGGGIGTLTGDAARVPNAGGDRQVDGPGLDDRLGPRRFGTAFRLGAGNGERLRVGDTFGCGNVVPTRFGRER